MVGKWAQALAVIQAGQAGQRLQTGQWARQQAEQQVEQQAELKAEMQARLVERFPCFLHGVWLPPAGSFPPEPLSSPPVHQILSEGSDERFGYTASHAFS